MARINEQEVYRWYDIMKDNNELVEIRLIGSNKTGSGYFNDANTLIEAIKPYTDDFNVYFTLNTLNPALFSREQKNKIVIKPKNTTQDAEVTLRKWVLIDLDSKRPSGVCATRDEVMKTYEKGKVVFDFLISQGFYEPILVFSSSGIHIYIKCSLLNTEDNTKLVKRFLNALSMLFSDEYVDCDTSVYNAARISRLIGSYSNKGSKNDKDRPQRRCRFISIPEEIKVNPREYFEKVASIFPEEDKPSRENNYNVEKFDLDEFIKKHNIGVTKIENIVGGKKYILEHCPWNPDHKHKDAVLFQKSTGEIAFHCFHQSDSDKKWRDFRLFYDPHAYDYSPYSGGYTEGRKYINKAQVQPFVPQEESEDKGKKWLEMKDIKRVNMDELMCIPTGYTELDRKIGGLYAGELTIVSGSNHSAKTTWLNNVCLNVVNKGFKCGVWSGEMQGWRFQQWIHQTAAGKAYTKKNDKFDNVYYTPGFISERIDKWLDGKLFLYNTEYGNNFMQIMSDVKELVDKKGVQLIILDNLAAMNIDSYDGEKYSKQTKFIIELKDYAKKKNIHIILVAHPRKETSFLRKESISGTADLVNIADNTLILHRVGKDFEQRASEFLGEATVKEYMIYTNIIEVCKNRNYGVVDYLVGMYYEPESRRLKNSIAEHIIYGWEDDGEQAVISALDEGYAYYSDDVNEEWDDLPPDY